MAALHPRTISPVLCWPSGPWTGVQCSAVQSVKGQQRRPCGAFTRSKAQCQRPAIGYSVCTPNIRCLLGEPRPGSRRGTDKVRVRTAKGRAELLVSPSSYPPPPSTPRFPILPSWQAPLDRLCVCHLMALGQVRICNRSLPKIAPLRPAGQFYSFGWPSQTHRYWSIRISKWSEWWWLVGSDRHHCQVLK